MGKDDFEPRFAEPITEWFKWFAWRPVETWDRGWRWLRPVYKRRCQPYDYLSGPMTWFFQYRVSKPVIIPPTQGTGRLGSITTPVDLNVLKNAQPPQKELL